MKTLIEIHALQNFAPSNLNRDDTGAPKDALFGGTRRARISSQCLKRAARQYFGSIVERGDLDGTDMAERTKRVLGPLLAELESLGRNNGQEAKDKVESSLAGVGLPVSDDGKNQYLLFLGKREIRKIAEIIDRVWDSIKVTEESATDDGARKGAKKKGKAEGLDPKIKGEILNVLDGGKAVDVALFGRMLADMPDKNMDAACQVAHAISTHAVEREFDFYTAVDDLKPEDSSGADMMGTVEFNSACFYRYAVVDYGKLVENLGKDTDLADKALRGFLEGFIIAEPTGKQNTFAAHNPPEFVSTSVRRNGSPRSLANAFETAVRVRKDESITKISAGNMVEKARKLKEAFGGEDTTFALNITGANVDGYAAPVSSLKELLDRTIAAVRG